MLDEVGLPPPKTLVAMGSPQMGPLPIDPVGPASVVAVLTDPAAAKSPSRTGVYGTGFSIDSMNARAASVMTGTPAEGVAIADAFVLALYEAPMC